MKHVSPVLEIFAEELKLARAAAELTQTQLAEAINYSGSLVAKIELAERRPNPDFARRCDEVLATSGLFTRIQRQVSRDVIVAWLQEWVAVEQEATTLRGFEPLYVPGLLQTEAYARTVLSGSGLLAREDVEQQVVARLGRQAILHAEHPPLLTVVVDEAVLRRPVGGPAVMREQLDHLVTLAGARPRVRIHVVPYSAGAYAGLDGPFVMATLPSGDDLLFVEGPFHGRTYDGAEDVQSAIQVWESVRGVALPQQQSLDLIAEVARTWT
ncbi:helix-turn-helix domain-containing protein [Micromonospora echinofusca]|uniref:helix-turn-helix domain-containing protein n=1 Tax=Micromonospora echinofusca TaxID=47858 RepID=UPI0027DDBAA3|nr:helix-turn-helix transcriptional regulator [Micromonospora echinofusca]